MNTHATQGFEHLPAKISDCLDDGRLGRAKELAAEIVRCGAPDELRRWLPELARLFERGKGRAPLAVLADLLWANKETALNDMYVLGYFMQFCGQSGVYRRFGPLLRSWIASDSTPDFTFSEHGYFRRFRKLSDAQKRDFADAKYRRWKDFESQDFFRAVEGFSEFATVSSPITDFLFEHRGDKSRSFSQWMREFRSAETLKHILMDASTIRKLETTGGSPAVDPPHFPVPPKFSNLVDVERAKSLFARLDLSKGLLLCTIHDGNVRLARTCAKRFMPELRALANSSKQNNIDVRHNAHLSAFKAVKVLREKKVLFMAPDASGRVRRGEVKHASEVKILGRPRLFADGAPTIAFESDCSTGWYTLTREGDRFVPVYKPGPNREAKESFQSFKERWWTFYAAQVEALFKDPRKISLYHVWPAFFGSAASEDFSDDDDDADYETTM